MFYKFNDQIEALGGKKQIIWHTAKTKDSIGSKKTEERDRLFLTEKIIYGIEFTNPYENSIEKKQKLLKSLKVIIKYQGVSSSPSLPILRTILLNIFIR